MKSAIITPKKGRPRLPDNEAKRILAGMKVSKLEDALIRKASAKAGLDKSTWMRSVLLEAATA
jgi:hypothetical protein